MIFGELLSIPSPITSKNNGVKININNEFNFKIELVVEKVNYLFNKHIDTKTVIEIKELANNLLDILKMDILYTGTDEEKEKQQGRALFERQKKFSFLLKTLAGIGLSSRRGIQVDTETLTITSMSIVNLNLIKELDVFLIIIFYYFIKF